MSDRPRRSSTRESAPAVAVPNKRARVEPPPPPPKPKAKAVKKNVVVAPKAKAKAKAYTPKVKKLPVDFLKAFSPTSLEALLLKAAALSPEVDSLLQSSISTASPLLKGSGRVQDFNKEVSAIQGLMRGNEGEAWSFVVDLVQSISIKTMKSAPLLTKLNALDALCRVEEAEEAEANGEHPPEYAEGESPSELITEGMLAVLSRMTGEERRTRIGEELVAKMDKSLRSTASRKLYGEEGREFEEAEPWTGCEEGEWKEEEEDEEEEEEEEEDDEEEETRDYSRKLVC
ncbi:hypothetical protein BDY24DRAFT_391123, partial [Mrakia frigida]|uniref:uncharacterized protein n=1 Tax=Mrakia frigida TaxID=29902 RepID=UPI003FCC212D